MKRWNAWILALSAASLLSAAIALPKPAAAEEPEIAIVVKGKKIASDTPPQLIDGHVLVPIRVIGEALGAKVSWASASRTVTVRKWSDQAALTVDRPDAFLKSDGSYTVRLDAPPRMVGQRVMVPLRFLSQFFGYQVRWDHRRVEIESSLSAGDRDVLYHGDLAAARQIAIGLTRHSVQPEIQAHYPATELLPAAWLFPEGEALRFYAINFDVLSYIEIEDDAAVVRWQAYIQAPPGGKEDDPFDNYLHGTIAEQWGTKPDIRKPLVYLYSVGLGDSNQTYYGTIGTDGKAVQLGYRYEVGGGTAQSEGIQQFELADEQRTD